MNGYGLCGKNDDLVDLRSIRINREAALQRRKEDFMVQVGNPYLFKVGDIVVGVEFCGGKGFSEAFIKAVLAG